MKKKPKGLDQFLAWAIATIIAVSSYAIFHFFIKRTNTANLNKHKQLQQKLLAEQNSKNPIQIEKTVSKQSTHSTAKQTLKRKNYNWGYFGQNSSQFWGDISKDFIKCKTGKEQSPINILKAEKNYKYKKINFKYSSTEVVAVSTNKSLQWDIHQSNKVSINKTNYYLTNFHFHTPSEHKLHNSPFDLEINFVHKDKRDNYIIIAVLVKEATSSPITLKKLFSTLPLTSGDIGLSFQFNPINLFPPNKTYYSYKGSLDVPPCTENIRWYIMKNPISISAEDISKISYLLKFNSRVIQPLNSRTVFENY